MKQEMDWDLLEIKKPAAARKFKPREKRFFYARLARLLRAGIPMHKALEITAHGSSSAFTAAVVQLREAVRQGRNFSSALEDCASFDAVETRLIASGEMSGQLDSVLEYLAAETKRAEQAHSKIREALAYPAFVLLSGAATLAVMLFVVIPRLSGVYAGFGAELPALTRGVMALSRGLSGSLWIFFLLAAAATAVLLRVRPQWRDAARAVPFFSGLWDVFLRMRTGYALALMLRCGVPVLQAFDAAADTAGDLRAARQRIAAGGTLGESLVPVRWMDAGSRALIAAGEESGTLAEAFEEISQTASADFEERCALLLKMLEPSLILLVGAVTGVLVIAMLLPMLSLGGLVQ